MDNDAGVTVDTDRPACPGVGERRSLTVPERRPDAGTYTVVLDAAPVGDGDGGGASSRRARLASAGPAPPYADVHGVGLEHAEDGDRDRGGRRAWPVTGTATVSHTVARAAGTTGVEAAPVEVTVRDHDAGVTVSAGELAVSESDDPASSPDRRHRVGTYTVECWTRQPVGDA